MSSTSPVSGEDPITLIQFPYSHFNEKVRWALDVKKVRHYRRNLLPGPHMPVVRRLTGQGQVPVLQTGEELLHGSAHIIDAIEARYPEPALYPADPKLRERALAVQRRFDDEVGPNVRRALFARMLPHGSYVCGMFSGDHSALVRGLYRAAFPLVSRVMAKSMGITSEAAVEEAFEVTEAALAWVATEAAASGYLVGDRFGIADLCAASLLAPAANPPDSPMERPRPHPEGVAKWVEHWAKNPGCEWVREIYARHRPPSAAL